MGMYEGTACFDFKHICIALYGMFNYVPLIQPLLQFSVLYVCKICYSQLALFNYIDHQAL